MGAGIFGLGEVIFVVIEVSLYFVGEFGYFEFVVSLEFGDVVELSVEVIELFFGSAYSVAHGEYLFVEYFDGRCFDNASEEEGEKGGE